MKQKELKEQVEKLEKELKFKEEDKEALIDKIIALSFLAEHGKIKKPKSFWFDKRCPECGGTLLQKQETRSNFSYGYVSSFFKCFSCTKCEYEYGTTKIKRNSIYYT
jgi:uncharacterized protein with PIN domain